MAPNKQREEIHKAIWKIANDLRGKVSGWEFKAYVLGFMFYRYISENIENVINQGEWDFGNKKFKYSEISDEQAEKAKKGYIDEKGYFIYPSQLFCNVRKRAEKDENLNITITNIFKAIEQSTIGHDSEKNFENLFSSIDLNNQSLGKEVKERNKKICDLLDGIGSIKLGEYQSNEIDAFGDAYEFLMGMYASNAGKSGGEYFTPQEVSELLTKLSTVGKKTIKRIYDPACGSGSLLLKAIKVLGPNSVKGGFYGQETEPTTYNLCRINMFLHNVDCDKFSIHWGDTLKNPAFMNLRPFDVIVSNPPYSIKWDGDDDSLLINDERFAPAGVLAPKSKADMAFTMHILNYLSEDGTASIVCFPGTLYRGGAEKKIRKYLVENNFVDAIIQLPDNLFFGTSISTCIMVLRKNKKDSGVLFINASKEFIKVTNSNKLTDTNINNIIKMFVERKEIKHVCHFAKLNDIEANDYNLSVSSYIEPEDTREKIDIVKLNKEIKEISIKNESLRSEIDKIIKEIGE